MRYAINASNSAKQSHDERKPMLNRSTRTRRPLGQRIAVMAVLYLALALIPTIYATTRSGQWRDFTWRDALPFYDGYARQTLQLMWPVFPVIIAMAGILVVAEKLYSRAQKK